VNRPASIDVRHDERAHRFTADVEGGMAVAEYEREDGRLVLTHTSVPPAAEGQGVGSALAREALGFARAEGLRVLPRCPFMSAYLSRHPEYQDLL
jgi:predicted GNAT family acetyltransferase